MTVYPNPNSGSFTVEITSNESINDAIVQLLDNTGRIISNKELNVKSGVNHVYFDETRLAKGTYIVRLIGGKKVYAPVKMVVN